MTENNLEIEVLGRPQKKSTRLKIAKAMLGKKNPAWKDGRRAYRRIAGAKTGDNSIIHHCYSMDTEYLTTTGWKTLDNIEDNETVIQVNDLFEWDIVPAKKVIIEDKESIDIDSQKVSLSVTKDHNILLEDGSKLPISQLFDMQNSRQYIKGGAVKYNVPRKYDLYMLEFLTAIVCDGIICQKGIRFNVSRPYKIEKLYNIFNNLGLHYTVRILTPEKHQSKLTKNNVTEFNINNVKLLAEIKTLLPGKLLPYEWITELSHKEKEVVIDTYLLFDGYIDPRNNEWKYWCSKSVQNADILQALMCLTGKITQKYKYSDGMYKLFSGTRDNIPFYSDRMSLNKTESMRKFGCLETDFGNLIVRRNGKAIVCGNSDGDRTNNRPSNLVKIPKSKRGAHDAAHNRGANFKKTGGTKDGAHTAKSNPKKLKLKGYKLRK